ASCSPATAGIPKERARIAVWCVGDPASMVTASTRSQSSSAASDGVRSSVTSTKLPGRCDREGASAAPPRLIWTRPSTSSRQLLLRRLDGPAEALDLPLHRLRREQQAEDGHRLPLHDERLPHRHARRDADAFKLH